MSKLSIATVAEHLDLSRQGAGRVLRELGLTTAAGLDEIRRRYIGQLRAMASNNMSPERERLLVARRRLLETELRRRTRQTIAVDEAERILVGAGVAARTRLAHADRQLRAEFPNLDEKVFAALRRLHNEAMALVADEILKIGETE